MTLLDLTLCFYTYRLDEASSWLCILVTPFGKFHHLCLPMGMMQSPDWAQVVLEEIFKDLLQDGVECYIDDVGLFTNASEEHPWVHHLQHLPEVLSCLEENGFTINPQKCKWAVQEAEWLGHWLTPDGIKPLHKKIQGMLAIAEPQTLCQLWGFIGLVNFYQDFWKNWAHIMAPLTSHTKTNPKSF